MMKLGFSILPIPHILLIIIIWIPQNHNPPFFIRLIHLMHLCPYPISGSAIPLFTLSSKLCMASLL